MNPHIPTTDELLHAWIDEELDPQYEAQFFSQLATDRELRDRLRQLRAVRVEARNFGAVAEPPESTTRAVFERLGFPAEEKKEKRTVGILPLFSQAWSPIASAAAAAAITAMIFLGVRSTDVQNLAEPMASKQEAATEAVSSSPAESSSHAPEHTAQSPAVAEQQSESQDASESARVNGAAVMSQKPSIAAVLPPAALTTESSDNGDMAAAGTSSTPVEASDRTGRFEDISDEELAALRELYASLNDAESPQTPPASWVDAGVQDGLHTSESTVVASSLPSRDADLTAALSSMPEQTGSVLAQQQVPVQAHLQAPNTQQYFPTLGKSELLNAISVELRGMNTKSFPEATIGTDADPLLENMAVSAYLSYDRHDIGLTYGEEPYSMHFNGIEEGEQVGWQQNLMTSWVVASWRYRFSPIRALANIEPYVTLGAGTSVQFWPMARSGFGLAYMPDTRVRFYVGLEGSLMAYPYQSAWFTSRRLGLTYGIAVLM
ncbi:hypothetical protein KQI65_14500 [bacterium]|nr:hypothetical protein [bacterium]